LTVPLGEFFVWWDDISKHEVEALEKCLASAKGEYEIQEFLSGNPILLIQHLGGGHGRWVIPMQRLGSEYVTALLLAIVILEAPSGKLLNWRVLRHACSHNLEIPHTICHTLFARSRIGVVGCNEIKAMPPTSIAEHPADNRIRHFGVSELRP